MKTIKARQFVIYLIILFGLLLTACNDGPQKESKPSADWSRSILLGDDSAGSVGLAVDETNQHVYIVWPAKSDQGMVIRFTRLEQFWESAATSELSFPGQIIHPHLLRAGEENLHLIWAERDSGESGWSLWHALLRSDGSLVGEVRQISSDEDDVGAYVVAEDLAGGAVIAWSQRSRGGVYLAHLDRDGRVVSGPLQFSVDGNSPAIRVGSSGNLHLAWVTNAGVSYVEAPLEALQVDEGQMVAEMKLGTGDSLIGPELGLSDGWVYIYWSIAAQSGLEAGTARTEFVAFEQGAAKRSNSERVLLAPEEEQLYEPYQGGLALTQLVKPPEEAWATTDFIMRPATMIGENSDLAVALSANQLMRLNTHMQIAVVVFRDGQYQGYGFASKTEKISDYAALFVGPSGNLYLLWREGYGGSDIYYATTEPTGMAALDSVSASDFTEAALQGGMEILVSIAFMPFVGFGWMLVGFLVVGAWKLIRDQDDLTSISSWIPLIIAFIAYYAVKLATLPTVFTYVPFSAWIHIPSTLEIPMRIGVPVAILLIALLVAQRVRKRSNDSAVLFYSVAALTDALLTLAVYGVNFLGVI